MTDLKTTINETKNLEGGLYATLTNKKNQYQRRLERILSDLNKNEAIDFLGAGTCLDILLEEFIEHMDLVLDIGNKKDFLAGVIRLRRELLVLAGVTG